MAIYIINNHSDRGGRVWTFSFFSFIDPHFVYLSAENHGSKDFVRFSLLLAYHKPSRLTTPRAILYKKSTKHLEKDRPPDQKKRCLLHRTHPFLFYILPIGLPFLSTILSAISDHDRRIFGKRAFASSSYFRPTFSISIFLYSINSFENVKSSLRSSMIKGSPISPGGPVIT